MVQEQQKGLLGDTPKALFLRRYCFQLQHTANHLLTWELRFIHSCKEIHLQNDFLCTMFVGTVLIGEQPTTIVFLFPFKCTSERNQIRLRKF